MVKSLDSAIIRRGNEIGFSFTQPVSKNELAREDLSAIPVIFQESLEPKLDVRVFVVGERMTSIAMTDGSGQPIHGDWRIPSITGEMCDSQGT